MGRRKGYRKFHGCDEDCANCPYPDCYKPVTLMKPMRELDGILKKCRESESQQKMYTVSSNLSKKFIW